MSSVSITSNPQAIKSRMPARAKAPKLRTYTDAQISKARTLSIPEPPLSTRNKVLNVELYLPPGTSNDVFVKYNGEVFVLGRLHTRKRPIDVFQEHGLTSATERRGFANLAGVAAATIEKRRKELSAASKKKEAANRLRNLRRTAENAGYRLVPIKPKVVKAPKPTACSTTDDI